MIIWKPGNLGSHVVKYWQKPAAKQFFWNGRCKLNGVNIVGVFITLMAAVDSVIYIISGRCEAGPAEIRIHTIGL